MRILVVEDEVKIAGAIKKGLELKHYAVDEVHDADTGLAYAQSGDYDAIVLDRMLPGSIDGAELASKLRADDVSTPILMLTARGTIGDKVSGLDSGVDDYLVKPFSFDELTARIRALLRRPASHTGTIIKVADLTLDTRDSSVTRAGQSVNLSHTEFALLEYMMRNQGQIVTKDQLITHIWDDSADVLPNTVEVYIGYLRNKVDRPFASLPPLIHTRRGFGYRLGE